MKQYKMIIAYDGTDFSGWIQQPGLPSIVQTLKDAFFNAFKKNIALLGASKTDAGVHALGQVVVFKTDLNISSEKMRWVWNRALPASITIRSLVHNDVFHPHENVVTKTYYYHIFADRPLPFLARYGYYSSRAFDYELLNRALKKFTGTHSFHAFYKVDGDERDPIRTIQTIKCEYIKRYNVYRITVVGERFLRHMVRRIVGAALSVAQKNDWTLLDIDRALTDKNIYYPFHTAPARGLLLYKIKYRDTKNDL